MHTQKHLKFSIVALTSPDSPAKMMYELPPNVIRMKTVRLQSLPEGDASLSPRKEAKLFAALEQSLLCIQSKAELKDLERIIRAIAPYRDQLGQRILLDSKASWDMLLRMYRQTMPKVSFLDYFWSWARAFRRAVQPSAHGYSPCQILPARALHGRSLPGSCWHAHLLKPDAPACSQNTASTPMNAGLKSQAPTGWTIPIINLTLQQISHLRQTQRRNKPRDQRFLD